MSAMFSLVATAGTLVADRGQVRGRGWHDYCGEVVGVLHLPTVFSPHNYA